MPAWVKGNGLDSLESVIEKSEAIRKTAFTLEEACAIAGRLKAVRMARGKSIEAVAHQVKISPERLKKIEMCLGGGDLTPVLADKISFNLGITKKRMIEDDENEQETKTFGQRETMSWEKVSEELPLSGINRTFLSCCELGEWRDNNITLCLPYERRDMFDAHRVGQIGSALSAYLKRDINFKVEILSDPEAPRQEEEEDDDEVIEQQREASTTTMEQFNGNLMKEKRYKAGLSRARLAEMVGNISPGHIEIFEKTGICNQIRKTHLQTIFDILNKAKPNPEREAVLRARSEDAKTRTNFKRRTTAPDAAHSAPTAPTPVSPVSHYYAPPMPVNYGVFDVQTEFKLAGEGYQITASTGDKTWSLAINDGSSTNLLVWEGRHGDKRSFLEALKYMIARIETRQ